MTRRHYGSLGAIDDVQLQAALDRFELGRLTAAEPLTNGLFGKNVALSTTTGPWVLRGDPWPSGVDDQFRRERFFAAAIRGACDVPVPWPYLIDSEPTVFGWPYALMPLLAGDTVDTVSASTAAPDWNAVAAALGRVAAHLRAVQFPTFGHWSSGTDGVSAFVGSAGDWLAERVDGWIRSCTDESRSLAATDTAWLETMVSDVIAELGLDPPTPGYVHHDLKPGNVVVANVKGRLEVSGLFDLGEGLVADPVEDLARCTWDLANRVGPRHAATFLRTYLDSSNATFSWDRLRAYVVFDLLVIWEFGSRPSNRWFKEPTFKDWAATMLGPVDHCIAATR